MTTDTNERACGQSSPRLQLRKSLVPINEYAAREGLSRELVEECGKLGIVQLRTYKGKTFVVNVPISPYLCLSEPTEEAVRPTEKNSRAQKRAELMQRVAFEKSISPKKTTMAAPERPTEPGEKSIKPGAISQLVRKMFDNASKITEKQRQVLALDDESSRADHSCEPSRNISGKTPPATTQQARLTNKDSRPRPAQTRTASGGGTTKKATAATDKIRQARPLPPVQPPDMEIFELPDESAEIIDDTDSIYESAQIPQDDGFQLSVLTAQARSKRIWQTAAVFSLGILFMAMVANISLLVNRRVQLDRLDEAYTSIQRLSDDTTQSRQQIERLQTELDNSNAQAGLFQGDLDKSRAELQTVRTELMQVRQDAESLRNELGKARAENGRLKTQLGHYETELSRLQSQLDRGKAELKTAQDKLALVTQALRTIRQRDGE
jgi:DNA repair exonuclease SbcCD ATPase subunit